MIEGHAIAVAYIDKSGFTRFSGRNFTLDGLPRIGTEERAMSIDWEYRRPIGWFLYFIREQELGLSTLVMDFGWEGMDKGSRLFDRH